MNGEQTVDFTGGVNFVDGATFTLGGDSAGTLRVTGESVMAGAFNLLANGTAAQTINWTGNTSSAGLPARHPGGRQCHRHPRWFPSFSVASGIDVVNMGFLTDEAFDTVSVNGNAFFAEATTMIAADVDGTETSQSTIPQWRHDFGARPHGRPQPVR